MRSHILGESLTIPAIPTRETMVEIGKPNVIDKLLSNRFNLLAAELVASIISSEILGQI
jgi:hypothetical protein